MSKQKNLLTKLVSHFNTIEATRKKVEKLYYGKKISLVDLEIIYKGLFIESVTCFELFIEDLFTGLLSKNIKLNSNKVKPKIIFNSSRICRNILASERSYVEWLPYERFTLKRAKIFFKGGYPFTSLSSSEKEMIEKVSIIRNAIAHNSKYSIKRFKEKFIQEMSLLPKEKTVVGYLRSIYTSNPIQMRFQYFIIEIASVADSIFKKL